MVLLGAVVAPRFVRVGVIEVLDKLVVVILTKSNVETDFCVCVGLELETNSVFVLETDEVGSDERVGLETETD